jgi:hypothetical protein
MKTSKHRHRAESDRDMAYSGPVSEESPPRMAIIPQGNLQVRGGALRTSTDLRGKRPGLNRRPQ